VTRALSSFLVALTLALTLTASRTRADDADEARVLFEEADAALDEGRFAAARDLLRRSIAAQPQRAAAFNLAVALRGTGELSSSIDVFEQLLHGAYGELEPERREQVLRLLEEVRREVATLHVRACGAPEISVRLDGVLRATLADSRPRELCGEADLSADPGEHIVRFDAPRATSVEQRVVLARGGRERVSVTLELLPEEGEEQSVITSPWLWLGVGAAVVVGVIVTLLLTVARPTAPRRTDEVFGEVIALRL
jgi:hypothetical protein